MTRITRPADQQWSAGRVRCSTRDQSAHPGGPRMRPARSAGVPAALAVLVCAFAPAPPRRRRPLTPRAPPPPAPTSARWSGISG
ncbi:hypothetical protein ACFQ60_28170 [Streptomyces zhihengii]